MELQSSLDSLTMKILKPILEHNNLHVWDKMKAPEAAHVIADGIDAWWASTSSDVKQEVPSKGRKKAVVSEDETEETVPKGWELIGMSFASVGNTNPSRQDLIKLITKHNGTFTEDVTPSTSYLLIGDDPKAKTTKRFADAKSFGVPVLHCDFIPALISRKPVLPAVGKKKRPAPKAKPTTRKRRRGGDTSPREEQEVADVEMAEPEEDPRPKGVILRGRKYAKVYLLNGKMHATPFPSAKLLKEKREAEEAVKSESSPTKSERRPAIQPGSALLQIDSLFPKSARHRIYVDQLNNAYNCTTSLSDISTDSFEARVFDLTGVDWNARFDKKNIGGRYRYVLLHGHKEDSEDEDNKVAIKTEETQISGSQEKLESKLEKSVQELIELIFNREMMEHALEDQDIDLQKMPLGK
ncbi:poly [ADP-ribose] polymerase 1-like [Condylostylus longicornis]|uniref:poly [ADP-ribose] polymerase 1-like n=1 Tax=Condylostylus longicornis TaxID=2530218 RepID=UPI00244DB7CB|nr:poly [ADP-ribose] polymerase 1-like [Condylostylus longicornis]